MVSQKHILLIEDERSIADTICYALKNDHFSVTWTMLGQDALDHLQENHVDLIILDIGLPDINGFELCKTIRQSCDTPIIFLTARNDEIDRVLGLEIGADDYVTKPFSPRELTARIKVILKRTHTPHAICQSHQIFHLDTHKKHISYHGTPLELTRYEYCLLELLLSQPQRIFSREQLMSHIWDAPEASMDRTVDAHIKSIRAKLRAISSQDSPIKTHRGMGYSLTLTKTLSPHET